MSQQFWRLLTKHVENPNKYALPEGGDVWIKQHNETLPHLSHIEAFFLFRKGLSEPPKHDCGTAFQFDSRIYKYKKSCPVCGRNTHNKKKIVVNGVTYNSKEEARKSLGLSVYELDKLILSEEVLSRYNKNGKISKEVLQERISSRRTMKSIADEFGVSYETLSFLFDVYNLPKKWYRLESSTYELLENREKFEEEFAHSNSEEMAKKYNCSPSTILQWADKYGIDRSERFQSAIERTLIEYIKSLDTSLEVIPRDKSIGMEVDIMIPSKKIGIELDGLYFHADVSPLDNRNKHLEKQKLAYKNGITLLRFVDVGETTHKLDIVKSIIKAKLGYNERIFARKCRIVYPTSMEASEFFERNHISGNANASIFIGLVYEGTLVEVCSFAESRFDKQAKWELIRLASKEGVTVVGGLSKIMKEFRRIHTGSILTYANLRFGSGEGYLKSGFHYIGSTGPGYFYTDMKRNYSRHMFRKDTVRRLIPGADVTKTELELAYSNGFRRYKDCGNAKYLMV